MKVSKAIEILTTFTFASKTIPRNDVNDAIKLGIEALKQVDFNRKHYPTNDPELLSGETPEEEK